MADIGSISDNDLENVTGGSGNQIYIWYTVTRGDTLTRIANKFKTTAEEIMKRNACVTEDSCRAGCVLLVPDNRL